jgi:hypothetical protein
MYKTGTNLYKILSKAGIHSPVFSQYMVDRFWRILDNVRGIAVQLAAMATSAKMAPIECPGNAPGYARG